MTVIDFDPGGVLWNASAGAPNAAGRGAHVGSKDTRTSIIHQRSPQAGLSLDEAIRHKNGCSAVG